MELYFDKTFVRKITLGTTAYLVEQNAYKQSITITHKSSGNIIYKYTSHDKSVEYEPESVGFIKEIFKEAHIQRYLL